MRVSDIAELVRDGFLTHAYPSVEKINNGGCYYFADALIKLVGEGEIYFGGRFPKDFKDLKMDGLSYGGHFVAKIDGLFYDADCTEGAGHPDQMNFYKKLKESIDSSK